MKKVLVTYIEAGMGHIVSAQAIAESLGELVGDNIQLVAKNLFHENDILCKYEHFLIEEVKKASVHPFHSQMQQFSKHLIGAQNSLKFIHSAIYGKQVKLYVEELKKINPDIIIDTHFFTSYCSVYYRDHFNPNCQVVTYDPDNNVHGWWSRDVDNLLVNNATAYSQALHKKFTTQQVKQVYFVARHGVDTVTESKEFYRAKYNIPQENFTVMLADSIYAKAKLKSFVMEFVKTSRRVTLIALTGNNTELYEKFVKLKDSLPQNITLLPLHFAPNIYELLKACDLFVTKAGPNAVLDSVFMRVPVLINFWANHIEHTTKKLFIDGLGCGVVIKNQVKARQFVEQCIDDGSMLTKYIENERKLDKNKNGAVEVAHFVIDKLNMSASE